MKEMRMVREYSPNLIGFCCRWCSYVGSDHHEIIENRRKGGIGICGRAKEGPEYVCKDAPVLTLAQLISCPGNIEDLKVPSH